VLKRNGIKRENKEKDKLSPFFISLRSFQSFPVIRVRYCLLVYLCRGSVSLGYVTYFIFMLLLLEKKYNFEVHNCLSYSSFNTNKRKYSFFARDTVACLVSIIYAYNT
jgi:hypothetical protein